MSEIKQPGVGLGIHEPGCEAFLHQGALV